MVVVLVGQVGAGMVRGDRARVRVSHRTPVRARARGEGAVVLRVSRGVQSVNRIVAAR